MDYPTIINGASCWLDDMGRYHRLDGPAVITKSGYQEYARHGRLHRLDGPAVIFHDGQIQYWINGAVPLTILDIIITKKEMVFDGTLVPEVKYEFGFNYRAYRFTDSDELALAILYYS